MSAGFSLGQHRWVLQGAVCPSETKRRIHQGGSLHGCMWTINADRNGSSQRTGRMLRYTWKKAQSATWVSRAPLEKGEFPDAVVGCPCENSAWPRPNGGCRLLLFHTPCVSRCLDTAHSPLPASEAFLPTAPGEQGWCPTGPLTSWQRPYASIVEHSSTVSIPTKEPQPERECTPGCTAPCPTRCPPTPSCVEYEVALSTSSERHHLLHSL